MLLTNKIVATALLSAALSTTSLATDCGVPPLDKLNLPSATSVDSDNLKVARDHVIGFSDNVDTYMNCMDQRGRKLLPYMSKDQQSRWEEDLTKVHEHRRELQIALNDLIREYRKKTTSN